MKSATVKFAALLISLLLSAVDSQAEQWRGIIPLKSTRADVERLLGKPTTIVLNSLVRYQLENEFVSVLYADKRLCNRSDECQCLVPDDTVLEISVELKDKPKFSTLDVDKAKFDKFPLAEDINQMIYDNRKAGLTYIVSEHDDKVLSIQYGRSAKDCEAILKKH